MPTLEELYLKTGEPITEDWYELHYNLHKAQIYESAVDFYGYVHKHLQPDADLLWNLGFEHARFREVHGGYGYFTYSLLVAGKRVLKDEDPIYISDIYVPARIKITEAIDYSKAYSKLVSIDETLLNLLSSLKPVLLASQINYSAPAMADIFADDITLNFSGRVRSKWLVETDAYAYVKFVPSGTTTELLGLLNAGTAIPARSWHEFDFTVVENDKINVRVSPSTTVSVILYKIESA